MKPLGKSLADGDNVLEPQIELAAYHMLPGLIRNFWEQQ